MPRPAKNQMSMRQRELEREAQYFQYVRLSDVAKFLATGWELADDMADCHHGEYSVLMRQR